MALFIDTTGAPWSIALNVALMRRIKQQLGVDLLKAIDDPRTLHALSDDVVVLVDTVWLCVESAAKELGVTDEQFGERLNGETLDQAARALMEALVEFFPLNRRPILQKILEKSAAMESATLAAINQAIDNGAIEQALATPGS
jgi:hypothetical protein